MNKRRGRPHHCRTIGFEPEVRRFKPAGIPSAELAQVILTLDEVEALRLADAEGLYHAAAAAQMQVSRQTFGRILASARRTVAAALIHGKEIVMQGGSVMQKQHIMGKGGNCICPACDTRIDHERGVPCREKRCPACGKRMLREGSAHHETLMEKRKGKST